MSHCDSAPRKRPAGNASSIHTTITIGTVASTVPTTDRLTTSVLASATTSHVALVATMMAPRRLLGRRHHATRPAAR